MNKFKLAVYGLGFAGAGLLGSIMAVAHAAVTSTPVTIPTDLAGAIMGFAGTQLADPGTETILLVVLGVPFAFYLLYKLRSLIPKK